MTNYNTTADDACSFDRIPDGILSAHMCIACVAAVLWRFAASRQPPLLSRVTLHVVAYSTALQVCFQKSMNSRCAWTRPVHVPIMNWAIWFAACEPSKCFHRIYERVQLSLIGVTAILVMLQLSAMVLFRRDSIVPEEHTVDRRCDDRSDKRGAQHRQQRQNGRFDESPVRISAKHAVCAHVVKTINMNTIHKNRSVYVRDLDSVEDSFMNSDDE